MDKTPKTFIELIQTEEDLNSFADKILFCTERYRRIERNRMHYIVFTPIWKQLWHKITRKKPYEDLGYKPKL